MAFKFNCYIWSGVKIKVSDFETKTEDQQQQEHVDKTGEQKQISLLKLRITKQKPFKLREDPINELAKLRRCVSRVHFTKIPSGKYPLETNFTPCKNLFINPVLL